ncbi:hypothetical protein WKW79_09895 [Variovorax robiniae]|uniref:WxL domain-containing protein n=1 Tax=Variovorax robiniae TaxID=1836199 RepID=A0ABU8X4Z9_9BURK
MKKYYIAPVIASLATPLAAIAESEQVTPIGAQTAATASAKLDFQITIPRVLFLQVGSGSNLANNTKVDLIDFTVPVGNVGDGSVVAASAASGDLGTGAVTVRLMANGASTVSLNSNVTQLNNGSGSNVGWNRIAVASAPLTTGMTAGYNNTGITHPAFAASNTGDGQPTNIAAVNGTVREEGKWTFTYRNQDILAAGTYGGVNTKGGRVIYTATMP